MKLPSARQHQFSAQPTLQMSRSAFDRKHSNSFTFNSGYLVPFFHDADVLPGDTINLSASIFARLNTPYFPIMTNVYMMVHFWAVPNRLVWEHWVNFQGEKVTPDDTTEYLTPISTIPTGGFAAMTLQDYFGLPVTDGTITCEGAEYNVFLFRAYNMIWNMGYRDQNLQDPVVVDLDDGPDDPADYVLLKRGKRHDYFTSCLPWAQKGDPVGISLAGNIDVWGSQSTLPSALGDQNKAPIMSWYVDRATTDGAAQASLSMYSGTGALTADSAWTAERALAWRDGTFAGSGNVSGGQSNVSDLVFLNETLSKAFRSTAQAPFYGDLTSGTAITINDFRLAFLTQELLEVDARGGTRYPEMIYAHFGVTNPDSRMQYPEFLGGDVTRLDITSVPQTSESDTTPQGNLAAFGTFSVRRNGFVKSFTEHCVVIGLLCVYADLTYSQGLPRHFSRRTRYDYYMPVLAQLGEQAVLNQEIYCQGTAGGGDDADTFGFQERWAEYRYMPNRVGGLFRPHVAGSLAAWNLSQDFATLPQLNDEFIVESPPFSRVVVVTSEPDFKADCYIQMTHVRPMPVQSLPVRLGVSGRRFF